MMWRRHSRRRNRMSGSSVTMNVEEQLALDETVARALHYVENLAAASLSETTVAEAETSPDPANDVTASTGSPTLATRQDDIDPDNLSYEALQSLGESIGIESRGLSDDVISLLPSSLYESSEGENVECAICLMSYISQEVLITLPCKHHYHSHCVTQWLKINKKLEPGGTTDDAFLPWQVTMYKCKGHHTKLSIQLNVPAEHQLQVHVSGGASLSEWDNESECWLEVEEDFIRNSVGHFMEWLKGVVQGTPCHWLICLS